LKNINHPLYMYHVASPENRISIEKNGLLSSKSYFYDEDDGGHGGIFFHSKYVSQYGMDTWKVDVMGLPIENDETTDTSEEWYVLWNQDVTPDRLELIYKAM